MTNNGSDTQLARYQELVDANARTPVYAVTGNHDTYTYNADIESRIATYTGNPLYYAFTQGEDVFIMLGIKSEGELFTDAELNWFAETLEENRNKRSLSAATPEAYTTITAGAARGKASWSSSKPSWPNTKIRCFSTATAI